LFMQRLRRAGQEGYDFDQDQDIWRDDDDDQPPPGAPPGAGRTRTGIRTQPVWLRQEPGGSSSSGQQPPGGGDGDVGASSSSGHHPGAPPPGAGAVAVDTRFNTIGAPPPAIPETEEPQTTPFTPQQGSFPRYQPPDPDFGLPARITSVRSHQRVDPEFSQPISIRAQTLQHAEEVADTQQAERRMESVATVRPPDASGLLESQRAHHQREAEQALAMQHGLHQQQAQQAMAMQHAIT
jgi:hypothetical protein